MKIYLDVSCLNRPFDDQTPARIRLESAAVMAILIRIDTGDWELVSSRMAEIEIAAISDETRRRRLLLLLPERRMNLGRPVFDRARWLVDHGLHAADAVHVAAAEAMRASVFLTCDDRLLRQCTRVSDELHVAVANPLRWLQEQENATDTG